MLKEGHPYLTLNYAQLFIIFAFISDVGAVVSTTSHVMLFTIENKYLRSQSGKYYCHIKLKPNGQSYKFYCSNPTNIGSGQFRIIARFVRLLCVLLLLVYRVLL